MGKRLLINMFMEKKYKKVHIFETTDLKCYLMGLIDVELQNFAIRDGNCMKR